jgi:serine/threonine-protein kinase
VDRAVAKDLGRRYPDATSMASDLEDVLAIEASRSGQATGEATTVLRTLPGRVRRRLPWRLRHPVPWIASFAIAAVVAGVVLWIAAGQTHRGTGTATGAGRGGLETVQLSQTAAHGYNPFGTGPENRDRIENLVDNDPNTTWSTETYYDGTLRKPGGVGLGVYLDAAPRVRARALRITAPTPGFSVQVFVADHIDLNLPYGDSTSLQARGWSGPVGESTHVASGERIALAVPRSYRYYLMWMTALPPGQQSATLAELSLLR